MSRPFFASMAEKGFAVAVFGSCGVTFAILVCMVVLGWPLITGGQFLTLLTGNWDPACGSYGIKPMIMTSLALTLLSLAVAVPLSIGTAVCIAFLAPLPFRSVLLRLVRVMAGIPTVLYGFVAVFLLVPFMREHITGGSGMNILTASLVLALLVSPTMIIFFVDSLRRVPDELRLAAASLGATPPQQLLYVIFPLAWPGMFSGILLGLGRAMGDTLISLMVAGNAVAAPASISDSGRTLTAHIALVIASDFESMQFKSIFACGVLLYIFTALLVGTLRAGNSWFVRMPK